MNMSKSFRVVEERERIKCPYLDTVDRKVLDFDLEKECSICLSHKNVYICLTCGVYLQGRGDQTHAFTHSLQNDHHVFLNIETKKFYCIPDNYEIIDHSLDDIKMALDPEFTDEEIAKLDTNKTVYRVPSGDEYIPGIMGMNVVGKGDYVNVVVQALSHITPIRNFFLKPQNYAYSKNPLVHAFGSLMRKLWSHNRFKTNVTPHEFLNEVSRSSKDRFNVKERRDAIDFLRWLVNTLIIGLKDASHKITIFERCFKGHIEITSKKYTLADSKKRSYNEMQTGRSVDEKNYTDYDVEVTTKTSDFLMLSLDLPPIPLFKNNNNDFVVNQMSLFSLLTKYDGVTVTKEIWDNTEKSYKVTKLPPYLIFTINRFKKNEFFYEKDTSIVQFPIRNLELRDFLFSPVRAATKEMVLKLNEKSLRVFISHNGEEFKESDHFDTLRTIALGMVEKGGMLMPTFYSTKYDLVGNVCHDVDLKEEEKKEMNKLSANPIDSGSYRIHVRNTATNVWYEIQELIVKETQPDIVSNSESSLLVYERKE